MRTLVENIPFLVVLVFPFLFKYPFVFTLFCKRPNQGPLKISESVTWPYVPHISTPNSVLIQLTLVKYGFMGLSSNDNTTFWIFPESKSFPMWAGKIKSSLALVEKGVQDSQPLKECLLFHYVFEICHDSIILVILQNRAQLP